MTATREKLVLESPAKVNLNLEVLGRRADGYHSIRSILLPISLHDTVTFEPGGRKFTFRGGLGVPDDEKNLAYRAVKLLSKHTGVRHGLDLKIVKRIPVAAGLGGGSSNAATVLQGVNELWDLGLGDSELEKIGLEIGSDVPFFLRGGTCIAGGRGEELTRIPRLGGLELVLVHPPEKISSEWAYTHIPDEITRSGSSTSMVKVALASGRSELLGVHLVNDLADAVRSKYKIIDRIEKRLRSAGATGAIMSGSGPTVFGIAPDAETADRIAEKVSRGPWKVLRATAIE